MLPCDDKAIPALDLALDALSPVAELAPGVCTRATALASSWRSSSKRSPATPSGCSTSTSVQHDAARGLGVPPAAIAWLLAGVVVLAITAGLGVLIWFVAHKIEAKRVADCRTGKNT
ncbi:hypothetical protein [Bradyrhizobium liaoningense]|uniref:hypothetical protein n=1 Tax=Bradyrhizobium liaoningense TaxID=43992 RepID=UPI001BAD7168|nr:hypothetical protein [Bradyrhizobium liaoningense]MBR0823496.1 hypothetical protein [Bradyrhizobium liaoningense]